MTFLLLALWMGVAVYLFGRSLAYLVALLRSGSWGWLTDTRMWLLLAPFLLPVAFYFYRADPSALVIVVLAFAMLMGWAALFVFRNLVSERRDDTTRIDRMSHLSGAGLLVLLIAVVVLALLFVR